jgi:hypothetical protein
MTITRYVVPLQGSSTDRYRHFHVREGTQITEFAIQYEAEIDNVWREIVRYDTAHGSPHRDLLHPDGSETKEGFEFYSNAQVLTIGQDDIRKNWLHYRQQYEREMRGKR